MIISSFYLPHHPHPPDTHSLFHVYLCPMCITTPGPRSVTKWCTTWHSGPERNWSYSRLALLTSPCWGTASRSHPSLALSCLQGSAWRWKAQVLWPGVGLRDPFRPPTFFLKEYEWNVWKRDVGRGDDRPGCPGHQVSPSCRNFWC